MRKKWGMKTKRLQKPRKHNAFIDSAAAQMERDPL